MQVNTNCNGFSAYYYAMSESGDKMVGERLARARVNAGFRSQAAFARALGINEVTYRTYEYGTRGIPFDIAEKAAKALNVSVLWLLTGKGEKDDPPPRDANVEFEIALLTKLLGAVLQRLDVDPVKAEIAAEISAPAHQVLRAYGADGLDPQKIEMVVQHAFLSRLQKSPAPKPS